MDNLVENTEKKMKQALDVIVKDFGAVRSGKVSPAMIEEVEIEAYEGAGAMKLNTLATISNQDAQTLLVTPFDVSVIDKIASGLEKANIGMNVAPADNVIRVVAPPLTEERRQEYVKLVNTKAENGKVMLRQVRHEAMEDVKKHEDDSGVSEDDVNRLEKEIQDLTDTYTKKIDELRAQKEKELMQL